MAPDPKQPPFATYLLPFISLPYYRCQSTTTERGRQSSTTSTSSVPELSTSPTSTPSSSPPSATFTIPSFTAKQSLESALRGITKTPQDPRLGIVHPNILRCITCAADIAYTSQIVSKGFTGRHGRAYLVSPKTSPSSTARDLINLKVGRSVNRELLTGQHVVADVSCVVCGAVLGWKYVDAREAAQKYKIGKVILEMKRVVMAVGWEDTIGEEGEMITDDDVDGDDVVVFNSEDEDECEDLFAGTWDPEIVRKRRSKRVGWRKAAAVTIPED